MKAELLGEYQVSGWGYRIPYKCLIVTKHNYKNTLKKIGGTKKLKKNIEQFFVNHPRAERVIISL